MRLSKSVTFEYDLLSRACSGSFPDYSAARAYTAVVLPVKYAAHSEYAALYSMYLPIFIHSAPVHDLYFPVAYEICGVEVCRATHTVTAICSGACQVFESGICFFNYLTDARMW